MRASLLARLDARDRALLGRWVLDELTPQRTTRVWRALTHLGGARVSIVAVLATYAIGVDAVRAAAWQAGAALLLSHLFVQLVKRRLKRERPTVRVLEQAHVGIPDQFSFPSGHSAAAMSVAFAFAAAAPRVAIPLVLLAMLVGFSRVRLGVHYPGDVAVGQGMAIVTVLALRAAGVPG